MKVKFLKLSAGPGGIIRPGTVVDVTPAEAEILQKGQYAKLLEPLPVLEPEEEKEKTPPETDQGQSDLEQNPDLETKNQENSEQNPKKAGKKAQK